MRVTRVFSTVGVALTALLVSSFLSLVAEPVIAQAASAGEVKMYFLKNPYTGESFFTHDPNEKDTLSQVGWSYEGVEWIAPESSESPVWRLYNPYNDDHLYTQDAYEYEQLPLLGWEQEGVKFYSDDAENVPVYRVFDSSRTDAGAHRYTTSLDEFFRLIHTGWEPDNAAMCYGLRLPTEEEAELPLKGWQAPIDLAREYLGYPYRWGGASPNTGFDCSGLVYFVYRELGIDLPVRDTYGLASYLQAKGNWKTDIDELEPGDIVFTHPGHVGIYVGFIDDVYMMIDSVAPGDVVTERPVYSVYYGSGTIYGGGSLR